MSPEIGLAWFRIALFMVLVSAGLLLFEKPGTAEFVITVTSLVIGFTFIGMIAVAVKLSSGKFKEVIPRQNKKYQGKTEN